MGVGREATPSPHQNFPAPGIGGRGPDLRAQLRCPQAPPPWHLPAKGLGAFLEPHPP